MKEGEFMAYYTIDELKNIRGDIAKQYGVKKVALFGSYSTGKQTSDSDIDLLIDKGEIKGLVMFNGFINSLQDRLNKEVDILTYTSLERSLIKDSVRDEVVLYEQ
ncbi:MAG: nucleotidyltransferase family protein [Clostridia bacterium]|nr:nucleotidyltransferase family protein [Clostridia bacterium]